MRSSALLCAAAAPASVCLPCSHPPEITIPAVILMQNDELSAWSARCPARPPAFQFDSSFHRRLLASVFPSVPCTCPLEGLCIINDSAAFSLRPPPSAPLSVTLGLACVERGAAPVRASSGQVGECTDDCTLRRINVITPVLFFVPFSHKKR